jgi:simple sugar transport system ATP-binding protein
MPSPSPELLTARGISKSFPGVRALQSVDFTLRAGEIHALLGENGAGKSTLIKVLTGVYPRDAGTIHLAGQEISPSSPHHAQTLGISTVYQEVNLVPDLSVAENIYLGRQPRPWCIGWRSVRRCAESAMSRLEMKIDVTRPLSSYSLAIQQMVAIARALDIDARVLILDEPTSSLDQDEVAQLFRMMRKLAEQKLGIVFVTHFLEQVYEVSSRITILRNGKLVGSYDTASLPRLQLVGHMLGRDPTEVSKLHEHAAAAARTTRTTPVVLEAQGVGRRGAIKPFDLKIHQGEIVGLAGLLGSGRTEIAEIIFGINPAGTGKLTVNGEPVRIRKPREAISRGTAFCPEDRKRSAIIPDLSVRENMVVALQAQRGWLRPLSRKRQNELATKFIKALNIATSDAEKPIKFLSGGNQQKVILGRWLACEPKLLLLDEPTRGIDIGAKFEIAKLMESLCAEGMAVLFISSELEEVARSSQRVVVLRDRQKIAELTGDEITTGNIMATIASSSAPVAASVPSPGTPRAG